MWRGGGSLKNVPISICKPVWTNQSKAIFFMELPANRILHKIFVPQTCLSLFPSHPSIPAFLRQRERRSSDSFFIIWGSWPRRRGESRGQAWGLARLQNSACMVSQLDAPEGQASGWRLRLKIKAVAKQMRLWGRETEA